MTVPGRSAEPLAQAAQPECGWTLDGLRALGVPQQDPLRWAYLQALASRTAMQQGALRQWLDARLAQALADCAQRCGAAPAGAAVQVRPPAPQPPSPLAGLLQRLDSAAARAADSTGVTAQATPAGELKALQAFKRRWARLSAEGQLARSAAQLPANPGPLNSQLLALRALQRMQALSPAYLQHFVAQVEALLWLDSASAAAPAAGRPAPRGSLTKGARPARGAGKGK